jgi:hypothetical protein
VVLTGVAVIGGACVAVSMWAWRRFPPTDAVSAWTLVAGLGAVVTAVSTVAIAAFALRGLRSLTIARDEIVHRAERDANLCAIQRLEEIARDLVPMNQALLDILASGKVKVFLGPRDAVRFDPDPQDLTAAKAWAGTLPAGANNQILTFLNRLEAWSVYFTKGVADPDVAFGPAAPVLRSWVGQYYAPLLLLRSGQATPSGIYPNLIELYHAWSARMDAQQLDRLHKDVTDQMALAQARLEQAKLVNPKPKIG